MTDVGKAIAQLQKDVERLKRASRLSSASLDDTALEVRDGSGSLRGILGQQGDGTTAVNIVNGGPPPAPATPSVAPAVGGIAAGWDGTFANGVVIPMDWARVEVHASPTAAFTATADTLKATIETAQGGIVYIPSAVPLYVQLLARNTSGSASLATAEVGPYAPKPVAGEIGIGEITETMIGDGAVTTPKVYANAVTTAKLAAGSVDATALKADAITGKTITGGDIVGATVTGSEIRTGTSGERVVLTPDPPSPLAHRSSILLYSGAASELGPGLLNTGVTGGVPSTIMASQSTAVDSLGRQIRSTLGLIPPNPGVTAGRFVLDALNPSGSTSIGDVYIDGATAIDAAGQSKLTLFAQDGATTPKSAELSLGTGRATCYIEALEVRSPATALSPMYVNASTGHSGPLFRLQLNAVDRLAVSAAGDVTAAGTVSADQLAVANTTFTSYTPTVNNGGSATYATRTGHYYKIGKLVYVHIYIACSAAGSGNTGITVTLPSTPYRGSADIRQYLPLYAGGIAAGGNAATGGTGIANINPTGSGNEIDQLRSASDIQYRGSNLSNTSTLTIQGWYREV
ncbi:hypothetical protein ACWCQM_11405 [Streptomyces sp. NPDC002125]